MENSRIKYADSFDRSTVEDFRRRERDHKEQIAAISVDDPEREEKIHSLEWVYNLMHHFVKGDRAEKKAEYVQKMIKQDLQREALLATTHPRTDIPCLKCRTRMVLQFKDIDSVLNADDRVLLIYFCPNKCIPGRAFYNDGTEWQPKPQTCEKCGTHVKEENARDGDILTSTAVCDRCGHTSVHTMDLSPKKEEDIVDEHYAQDRARFCMSDAELQEYLEEKASMAKLGELVREMEEDQVEKKTEEKIVQLRTLRIVELQTLITKTLEEQKFLKVTLSDPATKDDGLYVKLTAFDEDAKRTDEESQRAAKTSIDSVLKDTNWRLTKTSPNVTLGALSAELKGYTNETELRKLVQSENTSNPKAKTKKPTI